MKKLLAAMFVALLMTGWGEETHSSPPLTEEKAKSVAGRLGLKDYKIILNAIDSREKTDDYTGWAKFMNDNGQIKGLVQLKDGKPDGPLTQWYENGQKKSVVNWKDGKQDGLWTEWYLLENTRDILENLLSRSQTREAEILWEMTQYKRAEELAFVEDTRLDNASRKSSYHSEITKAKVEKVRINSLLRQIIQIQARINSRAENAGVSQDVNANIDAIKEYFKIDAIESFGNVPALREKLFELEQVERKLYRRTPLTKKQDTREVTASIEDVHKILQLEVKASIEDLKDKYHQLEAQEQEFLAAMDKVQSESVALSEMETKLDVMDRTLEIQRETTDKIQRRIQNLMIRIALSKEQKKAEGFFKDGKKDGFWIFWDENGQKEAQRNYENGRPVPVSPYEKGH